MSWVGGYWWSGRKQHSRVEGEQVMRVMSGLSMSRRWNVYKREAPIRERKE
jgi:hypothetical protein